jgi:uncharacterized integral membrane protein (TIGR00698 family)
MIAVACGLAVACAPIGAMLQPGLALWAKPGLKIGVAMLGAQIAWADVAALGAPVVLASGVLVGGGIAVGALIGVTLGLPLIEALIAATAVSICGASAAMAAASALPESAESRRTTALVVVGVNLLATAAMLLYPLIARAFELSDRQAGVFFGLSIHDVAQVAAAGASVSATAVGVATLAKLTRVMWLGPAVVLVAALAAPKAKGARRDLASMAPPAFVWGFAAFAIARSLDLLPSSLTGALSQTSHILLLGGVAAISAQVDPRQILRLEPRLGSALLALTCVFAVAGLAVALLFVRT